VFVTTRAQVDVMRCLNNACVTSDTKGMIAPSAFRILQRTLLATVLRSHSARIKAVRRIALVMVLVYKWVALLDAIVMQDLQMTA
jgi:hypothetical protein